MEIKNTELRERLAALEHDRWSRWERHRAKVAGGMHPSGDETYEGRWLRQSSTPYAELSEREKMSDRVEADKTLAIVASELDRLRAEAERLRGLLTKSYPIQRGPSVPWWVMIPHEAQSQRNHGQSIKRIAERGGFSPAEAWCVVTGKRWGDVESELDAADLWRAFAARVNDPRETKDVATILSEVEAGTEPCYPLDNPARDNIYIIFDGPPSHESGRFIEVENALRQSVSVGQWTEREDGYWILGPFRRAPQE